MLANNRNLVKIALKVARIMHENRVSLYDKIKNIKPNYNSCKMLNEPNYLILKHITGDEEKDKDLLELYYNEY